jgi:hypothetical protein
MSISSGAVANVQVASGANIDAAKLNHAHRCVYAQGSGTSATSATQVFHVVIGTAGTVQAVKAGAVVAAVGTDTCTIDVKKNGTSILSATISLTSSQTARQLVSGTVTTSSAVAGDVYEVVVTPTHSTGTLAQGIFVAMDFFENPN